MRLAIPAQERPARNVLIAGFKCAKIMPNRVERVSRFSARPAVSYIERSTRSPRAKKGLETLTKPPCGSLAKQDSSTLGSGRFWHWCHPFQVDAGSIAVLRRQLCRWCNARLTLIQAAGAKRTRRTVL